MKIKGTALLAGAAAASAGAAAVSAGAAAGLVPVGAAAGAVGARALRSARPQSAPAWATDITATRAITGAIPAAGVRSGGAAHGGWSTSVDLTVLDRGGELACGVRNRLVRRGEIEL